MQGNDVETSTTTRPIRTGNLLVKEKVLTNKMTIFPPPSACHDPCSGTTPEVKPVAPITPSRMSNCSYDDVELGNGHVHPGGRDIESVEGDIPAELFTEHGFPDVGIDAFVVVRSWVRDLFRRKRVVFHLVLEGELSRASKHRRIWLLGDFGVGGGNLGRWDRPSWSLPVI